VERLRQQARLELPFQSATWKALDEYIANYQQRVRLLCVAAGGAGALLGGACGLLLAFLDRVVK
jgi:hypothetical protein